jgi:small subunit ribosomal protein S19
MSRVRWKGPYSSEKILSKLNLKKKKKNLLVKIWSRSFTILPVFVNHRFEIYNGKSFISLLILENMVGHKFGEFVYTRARFFYKKQKKNKK